MSYLFWLPLVSLLLASTTPADGAAEAASNRPSCDTILERIRHRDITSPRAEVMDISGVWISKRCEVRPGPEYILRRYYFQQNNTFFKILQFYYSDPFCSRPFYGLEATGHLGSPKQRSWLVYGAIEAPRPMIYQVNVIPYTQQAAHYLQNAASRANGECSRKLQQLGAWTSRGGPYVILSFVEYNRQVLRDMDCTRVVGFNLHELQLMRLEEERRISRKPPGIAVELRRTLLLGSIATTFSRRNSFSSTSFQAPLVYNQNPGCRLCSVLSQATLRTAPEINDHLVESDYPLGEWVSTRCESRNQGSFVTRRLLFESGGVTWHGYYYHYHDALCHRPYFTIYATGTISGGDGSLANLDSQEYDFHIQRVSITPRDLRSVQLFTTGGGRCGSRSEWVVNVAQDVTHTGGCDMLGLRVPFDIKQILRVERHRRRRFYLLVGEMPNTGTPSNSSRPTSFQPPLLRCRLRVSLRPKPRRRRPPVSVDLENSVSEVKPSKATAEPQVESVRDSKNCANASANFLLVSYILLTVILTSSINYV